MSDLKDVIDMTFGLSAKLNQELPTNKKLLDLKVDDLPYMLPLDDDMGRWEFRDEYVKHSHIILSEEFIESFAKHISTYKHIVEVGCGCGYLTYWLKQYGIEMAAVDTKEWGHEYHLDFVDKVDGVRYIKDHPEIDLVIMSWPPYDTSDGYNIVRAMKPGQHLIYIGEDRSGCTGSDSMFDYLDDCTDDLDISDVDVNLISHAGIHDRVHKYVIREDI